MCLFRSLETLQDKRFLPSFRLRTLKFQSLGNAIPYPKPFHTSTRPPPRTISEKEKHINIDRCAGGVANMCLSAFWGHSLWGRENTQTKSPKILSEIYVYVFCFCFFQAPKTGKLNLRTGTAWRACFQGFLGRLVHMICWQNKHNHSHRSIQNYYPRKII